MTVAAERFPRALSAVAGLELSSYREEHVAERVRRALEREPVSDVAELVRLLARDPDARTRFVRSVAVSVSGLFRDAGQFELLEEELLPPLVADERRITVWSAGCADGSELYSTAVVLERLGALDRSFFLGSDVIEENVEAAKRAVYGEISMPEHLRKRMRWERRDLVGDGPPPGKWRVVLCRNVAIYLAAPAKRVLHETVAAALALGGVLVLGRSERLFDPESLGLERVAPHAYRRVA